MGWLSDEARRSLVQAEHALPRLPIPVLPIAPAAPAASLARAIEMPIPTQARSAIAGR